MKYSVTITGMHCAGCKALIQMGLEDEHIKSLEINVKEGNAILESDIKTLFEMTNALKKIFADLPGYSFINLAIID